MTARLLALAGWLLDRVMPPVRVHPDYLAESDRRHLEAARERRRDAIRHLDDPADIRRAFQPIVDGYYASLPRRGGGDS